MKRKPNPRSGSTRHVKHDYVIRLAPDNPPSYLADEVQGQDDVQDSSPPRTDNVTEAVRFDRLAEAMSLKRQLVRRYPGTVFRVDVAPPLEIQQPPSITFTDAVKSSPSGEADVGVAVQLSVHVRLATSAQDASRWDADPEMLRWLVARNLKTRIETMSVEDFVLLIDSARIEDHIDLHAAGQKTQEATT